MRDQLNFRLVSESHDIQGWKYRMHVIPRIPRRIAQQINLELWIFFSCKLLDRYIVILRDYRIYNLEEYIIYKNI